MEDRRDVLDLIKAAVAAGSHWRMATLHPDYAAPFERAARHHAAKVAALADDACRCVAQQRRRTGESPRSGLNQIGINR